VPLQKQTSEEQEDFENASQGDYHKVGGSAS